MTAPKPANFAAMVEAWDNPREFARQLNDYYAQLAKSRSTDPTIDITQPRHEPRPERLEITL